MDERLYALLADGVLILHASYVLFVIGGQALIVTGWIRHWPWTRNLWFRWLHLGAIGFVVAEAWLGVRCPLTVLENYLREPAGGARYEVSFIGYWLGRLLFYDAPEWIFTMIYTLFGLLVLVTLVMYPPRRT
ncbi:MAG: DUF2784 domain-containing protein [Gammaproteobacteria bacterium]|nr:DUF2784 domain-containing protein [Gammaproteobacteria bacterium]